MLLGVALVVVATLALRARHPAAALANHTPAQSWQSALQAAEQLSLIHI